MNLRARVHPAFGAALPAALLFFALAVAACGESKDPDGSDQSPTSNGGILVAETPTRTPARQSSTPTATPTRPIEGVEATATGTGEPAETWEGTYTGTIEWDCGSAGTRSGTLAGEFTITVDDGAATLDGDNTVTGSCAGPGASLTVGITLVGERTGEGFEFSAALWGLPGLLVIDVEGNQGTGILEGEAPGPAEISMTFEVSRV